MGIGRGETRGGGRGAASAGGKPAAASARLVPSAYLEHSGALRAYLVSQTRDTAAAEDLLHETFLRLLAEEAAGRMPTHPRAWLFRVAANLTTSRARRQGVAARRAPELLRREVVPSPEDEIVEREAAVALETRLALLAPDARLALLLAADGYTGAEIAQRIGRSELATRSLLCRNRSRLRAALVAA